ncbi:MAG: hypothetical protein KME50_24110 [Nostoc desertorum CM1-VF14]|nr:hypothetical protein [Nostoc desertorum CM1-VF14]
MGHGKELPMPNAQCPNSAGGYPCTDTWELSFPPTSIKIAISNKHYERVGSP